MQLRRLCAIALVATAAIHLAVVPEHLREWPAAAFFFVALAAVEVALAVAVMTRTSRRLLLVGGAVSAASVALWAVSRTAGLPAGPEVFTPEAVAAPDVIASALEVFAAGVFLHLATRHRRRAGVALVVGALALVTGACSTGSNANAHAHASRAVAIDTFMFSPKELRVHVGDTVVWTNKDNILHTVTSGTREYDPIDSGKVTVTHKDAAFDMQLDGRGATARHTFTKAGTQHYFCDRHPGMEADIDVA